jgi:DNA polymerase
MKIVTLDFETRYSSKDYTLSKMSTEAYVRDKRFKAHLCGFRWHDGKQFWIPRDQLAAFFQSQRWDELGVLAHHAHFDGLILNHHYGVRPRFWFDTLSMARHSLGANFSNSLDSLAQHFNLHGKTINYTSFDGIEDLDPLTLSMLGNGCLVDCELTWKLFELLTRGNGREIPEFPREEFEVIDQTIRMFTEPVLRADVAVLREAWEREEKRRTDAQAKLKVNGHDLRSDQGFADLLRAQAEEPETKITAKGNVKYCFAKTDPYMLSLLEHDDPIVVALAEARLDAKSSIIQTRAETFAWMNSRGPMPVYLNYCGASTLRFSGGDRTNFQNLKRSDPDSPKEPSPLRRAILAPEGFLLAPVDLSQIECRVLSYLAGELDALAEFKNGVDPYIALASQAYGYPVDKGMKRERGTGKQLKLSCGYMAGAATIQRTARLGVYGPPVTIDLETAERWKRIYRDASPNIVQYWRAAGRALQKLADGKSEQWGPLFLDKRRLWLPNGTCLIYDSLNWYVPTPEECESLPETRWGGWWEIKRREARKVIHQGVLTQNICEAVSRVIVTQAMIRLKRRGFRTLNIPHDELLLLLPKDGHEEKNLEICLEEMRREPEWLPGIPLACEGHLGERYEN